MGFSEVLADRLREREEADRLRQRRIIASPSGSELLVGGKRLLSFCSNDYLGLANHPEVVAAYQKAAQNYGVGSGASHLVCGHSREHQALEEALAAFTGRDSALLFSTGYMANLGVINALVARGDAVFEDKLNHASLLDAGLLCAGKLERYRHCDIEHLSQRLRASNGANKLIVTDGVFSMDGNLAPLPQLCQLSQAHDAWLMVDDAHGLGCIGESAGGCCDYFKLTQEEVPVLVGTLGKALGTFGAFVAGSQELIEAMLQFARTYIYTTALPPALAAATRVSLKLLMEEPWRLQQLHARIRQFKQGCEALGIHLMPSDSPIQPLVLGSDKRALQASQGLEAEGIWVSAIRPPTVPLNSARLRITLSAAHSAEQVDKLLDALQRVAKYPQESL